MRLRLQRKRRHRRQVKEVRSARRPRLQGSHRRQVKEVRSARSPKTKAMKAMKAKPEKPENTDDSNDSDESDDKPVNELLKKHGLLSGSSSEEDKGTEPTASPSVPMPKRKRRNTQKRAEAGAAERRGIDAGDVG